MVIADLPAILPMPASFGRLSGVIDGTKSPVPFECVSKQGYFLVRAWAGGDGDSADGTPI